MGRGQADNAGLAIGGAVGCCCTICLFFFGLPMFFGGIALIMIGNKPDMDFEDPDFDDLDIDDFPFNTVGAVMIVLSILLLIAAIVLTVLACKVKGKRTTVLSFADDASTMPHKKPPPHDDFTDNPLITAIRNADVQTVKGMMTNLAADKQDMSGCTVFHHAVQVGDVDMLDMLLEHAANTGQLPSLTLQTHSSQQTPLHIASEAGDSAAIAALIKYIDDDTLDELLSIKDREGKMPCESCTNSVFINAYNKHMEVQDKDNNSPKDKNWKVTWRWIQLFSKKDKFGFTVFDNKKGLRSTIELLDTIYVTIKQNELPRPSAGSMPANIFNVITDNHIMIQQPIRKLFPKFILEVNTQSSFTETIKNNILSRIAHTQNLALIKHPSVQLYVTTCYKSFAAFYTFLQIFLYIITLLSLTVFVSTHKAVMTMDFTVGLQHFYPNTSIPYGPIEDRAVTLEIDNDTWYNQMQEYMDNYGPGYLGYRHEESYNLLFQPVPYLTETFRWIAIVMSLLFIIYELIQMKIKKKDYFYNIDNICECLVYISVCVVLFGSCMEYNSMWHMFGSLLIIVATLMGSWIFGKISGFVGTQFIILLKSMWQVFTFLPVIVTFICVYSVSLYNVLRYRNLFSLWTFLVKTMTMAIGEIEYISTFVEDIFMGTPMPSSAFKGPRLVVIPHDYWLKLASMCLILPFLLSMPIALMNLLVGAAVGNVPKLIEHGVIAAFQTKVELILEYSYLLPNIQRKYSQSITALWPQYRKNKEACLLNIEANYAQYRKEVAEREQHREIESRISSVDRKVTSQHTELDRKVTSQHTEMTSHMCTLESRMDNIEDSLTQIINLLKSTQNSIEQPASERYYNV